LLDKIFDPSSGRVLASVCPNALKRLRQFCEYFSKLALEFDPSQDLLAEIKYEQVDSGLSDNDVDWNFVDRCRRNWETHMPKTASMRPDDIIRNPRYGPGAFFGSEIICQNYDWWEHKLLPNRRIGSMPTFNGFEGFFKEYPDSPLPVYKTGDGSPAANHMAAIKLVPKDANKKRVISKEEFHLLPGQLAYFDNVSRSVEAESRGHIQFTDQQIMRDRAREGSLTRLISTLDLKEASDRVRRSVIRALYRYSPGHNYWVSRLRATMVKLPVTGLKHRLKKFGNMGNGLTFVTMAILIYIAVCTEISHKYRRPFADVMREVYVYGDDLQVPSCYYSDAQLALEKVGLMLNPEKCFRHSHFRESCGGDFYRGVDVAPVRLKLAGPGLDTALRCRYGPVLRPRVERGLSIEPIVHPRRRQHLALQFERHARELVKKGLFRAANYIYSSLEKELGAALPFVYGNVPYLGRYTTSFSDVALQKGATFEVFSPVSVKSRVKGACVHKSISRWLKNRREKLAQWTPAEFKTLVETLARRNQNLAVELDLAHADSDVRTEHGFTSSPRQLMLRKKVVGRDLLVSY
jgi:hypothetical protein